MTASTLVVPEAALLPAASKAIKLVVWDLDNTIWEGILLEDKAPELRDGILETIRELDELGILQSVASRSDYASAKLRLVQLGIDEYLLAPQISWRDKSISVQTISNALNVGLDSVLFIDDQDFELEEVAHVHPQVRTLNATQIKRLLEDPSIRPRIVTGDARRRRMMYIEDDARRRSEAEFVGPNDAFLATLNMKLRIAPATHGDLDRAEELTLRTNQLNSTGSNFSRDQLDSFIGSKTHKLLIVDFRDRFGDYGKIGLALIEFSPTIWTLKLILVSCRVLSRGIGTIFLNNIAARATTENVLLQVEFRETGRNRPMKMALMMAGFKQVENATNTPTFARGVSSVQPCPNYVDLNATW